MVHLLMFFMCSFCYFKGKFGSVFWQWQRRAFLRLWLLPPLAPLGRSSRMRKLLLGSLRRAVTFPMLICAHCYIAHDRDINRLHAAAALAFKFSPDAPLAATLLLATKAWQDKHRPGQAHEPLIAAFVCPRRVTQLSLKCVFTLPRK